MSIYPQPDSGFHASDCLIEILVVASASAMSFIAYLLHSINLLSLFLQLETFKRQLVQSLSDDNSSVRFQNFDLFTFHFRKIM